MKFEAVLFDMDGTLLDTLGDLAASCNYAMAQMGYPLHTEDEVRTFINNGARRLVTAACPPGTTEEEIDRCLPIFQGHYSAHLDVRTRPYPGVMDLLGKLSGMGVKTAVVSNKYKTAVEKLSDKYFGPLMQAAVGEHEEDGVRRKPWPDTVFEALKALDVPAERALYVGDTDVDLLTAKNANLPCLSVSWGFKSREMLEQAGAKYIADSVEEFLPLMERMEHERGE